jgi:tRNA G18 (ribose-2'-O)-methylase SpoU
MYPVTSLSDPRLEPYRDMKDRELAGRGDLFVAEGEHVVRRLLDSGFAVHSVLLAERKAAALAPLVPPPVPVYVAPDALLHHILGFKFHSGVIACGVRPPSPQLDDVLGPPCSAADGTSARPPECASENTSARASEKTSCVPVSLPSVTLLICPDIINTQNLGAIIRIAAAFGVTALILGPRCCDPFWRQSVRVSMGAVFRVPIVRSADLTADLRRLRKRWGVQLAATVLGPDAEPLDHAARPASPAPDRLGLLLGSEAQGLDAATIAACDRRITIPMQAGVDSLNVAAAAAVFLYHFTRAGTAL